MHESTLRIILGIYYEGKVNSNTRTHALTDNIHTYTYTQISSYLFDEAAGTETGATGLDCGAAGSSPLKRA